MSVNGLLPEEKGKHVLRKWSVEHKRAVCNSVISGLLASYAQAPRDDEDGDEDLLSDFESLNWTMEVVGAAFALPFDDKVDLTICQGALNLLFRWLLSTDEPSGQGPDATTAFPFFTEADEEDFILVCFKAISLMFLVPQKRHSAGDEAGTAMYWEQHGNLCTKGLTLMLIVMKERIATLGEKTTETVLRIMLGIANEILLSTCTHDYVNSIRQDRAADVLRDCRDLYAAGGDKSKRTGSQAVYRKLATRLCPPLMKTLLEVWVLARPKSDELWFYFKTFTNAWFGTHVDCIKQFAGIFYGLTTAFVKCSQDALEGGRGGRSAPEERHEPPEADDSVSFYVKWSEFNMRSTKIVVPDRAEVVVLWKRILQCVPAPNSCTVGGETSAGKDNGHTIAVNCLLDAIHLFLGGGSPGGGGGGASSGRISLVRRIGEKERLVHENSSSLFLTSLKLFGSHVFLAAARAGTPHDSLRNVYAGRACAIKCLCKLFIGNDTVVFSAGSEKSAYYEQFLAHFYSTLITALETEEPTLVSAVLMHGSTIFASQLKGNRVLLPYILKPIYEEILRPKQLPGSPKEWGGCYKGSAIPHCELRRSCLTILKTLLPFPNRFAPLKKRGLFFKTHSSHRISRLEGGEGNAVGGADASRSVYHKLRECYGDSLVNVLKHDRDEQNLRLCLDLIYCKLLEDREIPGLAQVVVSCVCSLCVGDSKAWADFPLVRRDSIQLLKRLVVVAPEIHVVGNATLPSMLRKFSIWAQAKALETVRSAQNKKTAVPQSEATANIVAAALDMLLAYVMRAPFLLKGGRTARTNTTVANPLVAKDKQQDSVDCLEPVVQVALTCAGLFETTSESVRFLGPVQKAGARLLNYLLHHLGRRAGQWKLGREDRPVRPGQTSYTSLIDEHAVLSSAVDTHVSYFGVGNHTIVCVTCFDGPEHQGKVIFVMRTADGIFSWSSVTRRTLAPAPMAKVLPDKGPGEHKGLTPTAAEPRQCPILSALSRLQGNDSGTAAGARGASGRSSDYFKTEGSMYTVTSGNLRTGRGSAGRRLARGSAKAAAPARKSLYAETDLLGVEKRISEVMDVERTGMRKWHSDYKTEVVRASSPPSSPQDEGKGKGTAAFFTRLAMYHVGLISDRLGPSSDVRWMQNNAPKFKRRMDALDGTPIQALYSVDVTYVDFKGEGKAEELALNGEALDFSPVEAAGFFYKFLLSLGWPHARGDGGRGAGPDLQYCTQAYVMDVNVQVWEELVGVLQCTDGFTPPEEHCHVSFSAENRAKGPLVGIVWSNNAGVQMDHAAGVVWRGRACAPVQHVSMLHIVLTRLSDSVKAEQAMVKINIFKTDEFVQLEEQYNTGYVGGGEPVRTSSALFDGMIVRASMLHWLVRETIEHAHVVYFAARKKKNPIEQRAKLIKGIIQEYCEDSLKAKQDAMVCVTEHTSRFF
jgi:hypothetical protein